MGVGRDSVEVSTHTMFKVTYTGGTVEQIEADEPRFRGGALSHFRQLPDPAVSTVYTETARQLDRRAAVRVDEAVLLTDTAAA